MEAFLYVDTCTACGHVETFDDVDRARTQTACVRCGGRIGRSTTVLEATTAVRMIPTAAVPWRLRTIRDAGIDPSRPLPDDIPNPSLRELLEKLRASFAVDRQRPPADGDDLILWISERTGTPVGEVLDRHTIGSVLEAVGTLSGDRQLRTADAAAVSEAAAWLNLPAKRGGPATDKQATFVRVLVDAGGRLTPADLNAATEADYEDPVKGCRQMANRINERVEERERWSIDPSDRACVVIVSSMIEDLRRT